MPYKLTWYVVNHVILIEITGHIDLTEFEQLHNEAFEYVANSQHKVHAIADLSQFEAVPTNLRMLSSATNKEKTHKQGMTVLVMPKMPGMIRFIVSLIMQTLRLEYRICESIDEAMSILERIDINLSNMATES